MGRTSNARERLLSAIAELIWVGSYGATTVDGICEKAGVKKGSFYYFFKSKTDLAIAAIEADWQARRPELDAIFSPVVPPLERFRKLCEYLYQSQLAVKRQFGRVLGCPLFALGAEVSTQEARLQQKISEILNFKRKYFETAIRDAQAAGLIHAANPEATARMLFTYYQGLLTEARIRNDLEILRDAARGTFEMLGVATSRKAA